MRSLSTKVRSVRARSVVGEKIMFHTLIFDAGIHKIGQKLVYLPSNDTCTFYFKLHHLFGCLLGP